MSKLIMTKGLPASGKTTWAKEEQGKDPNTIRVNKDDLRAMLHNSVHSNGREDFVLKMRDFIIQSALAKGTNVIIDDTNFNPVHEARLSQLAREGKAEFLIREFTEISVEECIKRDLKRQNSVGEKVIRQMYKQYLKPKPLPAPEHIPGKQYAIICDLDGTLALFGDKNPYERDFENDEISTAVRYVLDGSDPGNEILFVSGRKDIFRDVTQTWLDKYGFGRHPLFMRKTAPEGQQEPKDSIVKKEIYENEIKGKYNILFVLDDRNQVVEFWRDQGLTVLQVAEGDF